MNNTGTSFSLIYDSFLSKITDDMFADLEFTREETLPIMQSLLETAIYKFEFPRKSLNYQIEDEDVYFESSLNQEEINILSTYMVVEWISVQIASVDLTKMKYSGSDFKFTSQANHISKLLTMKQDWENLGKHLQRLYKRREVNENGVFIPTMSNLMKSSFKIDLED